MWKVKILIKEFDYELTFTSIKEVEAAHKVFILIAQSELWTRPDYSLGAIRFSGEIRNIFNQGKFIAQWSNS